MERGRFRDEHLEPLSFAAGGLSGPSASDPAGRSAFRAWRGAEDRLCNLVMVDPDLYERSVTAVRSIADALGRHHDEQALLAAWRDVPSDPARLALAEGAAVAGPDVLVGAAFSLRHREIRREARRSEILERIRTARAEGGAWTVLEESGGLPFRLPYHRLEMHLATGIAMHALVEEDDALRPAHTLEVMRLDPATGEPAGSPGEGGADPRIFASAEALEAAMAEFRDKPVLP